MRLRELSRADLPALLAWRNDPEVSRYLASTSLTHEELERWFTEQSEDQGTVYFSVETGDRVFIGYTGLRDIDWSDRSAMLDLIIGAKEWWNRGVGEDVVRTLLEYAFSTLNLNRVSLGVLPSNKGAIRCYEKVGFRRVGFLKEHFYREGRVWPTIHMEIVPQQFRLAQKRSGD